MYGLSMITWLLIHLTIWVICLVIIVPLSVVLWVLLKDLLMNDGMKIREKADSLYVKSGLHSETEYKRLPIKRKGDFLVEKEESHEKKSEESKPEEVKGGLSEQINEGVEKVDDSVADPLWKEEPKKESSIIYLDPQTSLTTDFPEELGDYASQK